MLLGFFQEVKETVDMYANVIVCFYSGGERECRHVY